MNKRHLNHYQLVIYRSLDKDKEGLNKNQLSQKGMLDNLYFSTELTH